MKNQFFINTMQGVLVEWIFYLWGDNIYSATKSTSVLSENAIMIKINKTLILFQFQRNIKPIIQQASDILSTSEQHISQNPTSLWYSINLRAIYIPTITIFLKISPLPPDKFQSMLDQLDNFHSKQEVMKISEVMDTPYDQGSDKQQKLLIDYLYKKLTVLR